MLKSNRYHQYNFLAVGLYLSILSFSSAAINDPTKPIYSENGSSHIVTNRVIEEKKVILLQSIFLGKDKKLAIINGEMLKEGDEIDSLLMESIEKSHVVVKYNTRSIKVFLSKKVYVNKRTGEVSE